MAPPIDPAAAAGRLWRRQLILTGIAVVVFGAVSALTRVVLSDWGRRADNRAVLYGAAAIAAIALAALLVAACLHAVHTLRLTFRSLDASDPAASGHIN